MRPGRIDACIHVPLPDEAARRAILSAFMLIYANFPESKIATMPVSAELDIERLVEVTEGYSGAEIVGECSVAPKIPRRTGVCREAALGAMREDMNVAELSDEHFVQATTVVQPHTDASMLGMYEEFERGTAL